MFSQSKPIYNHLSRVADLSHPILKSPQSRMEFGSDDLKAMRNVYRKGMGSLCTLEWILKVDIPIPTAGHARVHLYSNQGVQKFQPRGVLVGL